MNARTKKFVPLPRHALDFKSQLQTAQAVNALLNSKMIVGQNAEVHHSDSNVVYELPPGEIGLTILPFCFYNAPNTSKAMGADGKQAPQNLIFQMRDGIFAGRSKFNAYGTLDEFYTAGAFEAIHGNFEIRCPVVNDGAFLSGFDLDGGAFEQPTTLTTFTLLDANIDTVLFNPSGTTPTGQIVLNAATANLTGTVFASFWLEINDTLQAGGDLTTGYFATLKGRMINTGGTGGQTDIFPASAQNIIPLGFISTTLAAGYTPTVFQFQCGNFVNVYPAYVPGAHGLGQMTFRGDWTNDNLSGQYFYPGDLITSGQSNVNKAGGGTISIAAKYIRITYGKATVQPVNGIDWRGIDF